jgi:hypothetical protein
MIRASPVAERAWSLHLQELSERGSPISRMIDTWFDTRDRRNYDIRLPESWDSVNSIVVAGEHLPTPEDPVS